jgi:hypothetical protein
MVAISTVRLRLDSFVTQVCLEHQELKTIATVFAVMAELWEPNSVMMELGLLIPIPIQSIQMDATTAR